MSAGEVALRFLLGGVVVSLFALIGELFKPKTFAGLFGAAPSVAIATLGLAYVHHGPVFLFEEARSMIVGAFAFTAYGAACVFLTQREHVPIGLSAALSWIAWLAVTAGGVAVIAFAVVTS
ncbi:MAG: DUF3147 family protein [Polyangiaceae bacterium]